jgi:hypothetical protein
MLEISKFAELGPKFIGAVVQVKPPSKDLEYLLIEVQFAVPQLLFNQIILASTKDIDLVPVVAVGCEVETSVQKSCAFAEKAKEIAHKSNNFFIINKILKLIECKYKQK